jgi:hypothetical protein
MKPAHELLHACERDSSFWGHLIISAEERGYWTKEDKDFSVRWITAESTCMLALRDPCVRDMIIGFDAWVTIGEEFDEYPANEDWSCFFLAGEYLIDIEQRCELLYKETLK